MSRNAWKGGRRSILRELARALRAQGEALREIASITTNRTPK